MTKQSDCYHEDFKQNWIQTHSGRQFFPFDPSRSEIVVEDIAHALSNTCRFTGHVKVFYSVAQHSVLVASLVPVLDALTGLLHDASEAYLCDIPSPIKPGIPKYKELELAVEARIAEVFDTQFPMPDTVRHADQVAVATEARDLMANPPTLWKIPAAPLPGIHITPWTPERAEQEFLALYRELIG